MEVSYKQARRMIIAYMKSGLVPMMKGSPGIGKSAIVHQIAAEFNLLVIDLRLSQCDPTDLLGFPQISGAEGHKKAGYAPMETFPIEGDPLPVNPATGVAYDGWLLFLDEFNSANRAVQAAAYKLVLDRMVGQYKLHPRVRVVCAGNKQSDGAIVEDMSTALQSRLVHFELALSHSEWLDHAYDAGYDHRISDYLKFKGTGLYTFKPDHTDDTYACPRTWEFVNRLLKQISDINDQDTIPLLAGTISEGVAREFVSFCRIYNDLPKIEEIIDRPDSVSMSNEPSVLYALSGTLANHAKSENITSLMRYIKRMAKEFQVITLRETIKRSPALMKTPALADWIAINGEALF